MKKIKFNTGRKYAANGQPIVAVHIGDSVIFKDEARLIVGSFDLPAEQPLTQRAVMQAYDSYGYHMAAWRAEYDAEPEPKPETVKASKPVKVSRISLDLSPRETIKARMVSFAYSEINYGFMPTAERLAATYLERFEDMIRNNPGDSESYWANFYFDKWKSDLLSSMGEI